MRENLGQLRSRGVSGDVSLHPAGWFAVTGGYQFAKAYGYAFCAGACAGGQVDSAGRRAIPAPYK